MQVKEITNDYLGIRSKLLRFITRIVKSPEDAEDILQEAYIKTWNASDKKNIDNPKGFLTHAARNLAINHINLARVKNDVSLEENESCYVIQDMEQVELTVEHRERLEFLSQSINRLPPQCRQVFIHKRVYGLSHKEISEIMKISTKTIEKHITRGLRECTDKMKIFDKDPSGVVETWVDNEQK